MGDQRQGVAELENGLRLKFCPGGAAGGAAADGGVAEPGGVQLTHEMMLINGFLGEVVRLESILDELSYNIALYGDSDRVAPWAGSCCDTTPPSAAWSSRAGWR